MSGQKIKAVAVTGPQQAELVELDADARPLAGDEVESRTLVSLISAGTELNWAYLGQKFPAYPGYAAVAQVERVGTEVKGIAPGRRVFVMGGHRSTQRTRAAETALVPEGLPAEEAVFARMMVVTMTTLATTAARPPERVVVTGLGPVGHMGAQIFAGCGYEVIGVDPSAARRELAKTKGLSRVEETIPPGAEAALVVECSGHEQAVLDACKSVRKGGEVVLTGVPWRRRTELSAFDLLHAVFHRYVRLRSGWEWEIPRQATDFVHGSIWGHVRGALGWLVEGRVSAAGLYELYAPSDCQRAYQDLLHNRGVKLAALLDWCSG